MPLAILFSEFSGRVAAPFSLAAHAGSDVFLVADIASCFAPNGLLIDAMSLDIGGGNLIANPGFTAGFGDWWTGDSSPGCVLELLEEGDSTAGAGAFDVPAPTTGEVVFATDATDLSQCVLAQEVSIPGGADAATFSGTIGANILVPFVFFMDVQTPEPEAGDQLIWFRTADIPLFNDIDDGDAGQFFCGSVFSRS